jgi:NAD(P)-dependent dehydrogenase (short-subunit alcohol dehydrogenase family)
VPLDYDHSPVTVAGKRAVVLGGTSGIGRAIALAFASEGADVAAASRTEDAVERTAAEIRDRGAETVVGTVDVTDRESIRAYRDRAVEAFGGVDVLVNSPGTVARESVTDVDEAAWDRVFDVLLTGTYRATQEFAAVMETGAVVNISSMSAVSAIPNLAAYSTAKGGVDAFTRVAAEELGPEIRVNAVRPGFILTAQSEDTYSAGEPRSETIRERTTQGRLGRPDEVAGAAVYLASDAASYTTGAVLTVDDGFDSATFPV